jgi:8-oxo-dGTP pyrophosphatase MutT (NUDIX family)
MTRWIDAISSELSKPLPGLEVQMRMAPSLRRPPPVSLPMRDSGVLILLYSLKDEIFTVFMKRPEYGGPHSGQISFPGGKHETADLSLIETALRESKEEIGINPSSVEILGTLTPLYIPVSNFKVLPVVGYVAEKPSFRIDPEEVDFLIEVSLQTLMNQDIVKYRNGMLGNESIEVPYFDVDNQQIWGATAMILSEFLEIIKRAGWQDRVTYPDQ